MASNDFPLDEAQIIALFMESIFFGFYLVSFAACMRLLLSERQRKAGINKIMFVGALALGTFATLDLAFGLRHVLDAFIWFRGPAIVELGDISYWVNVMKSVTYVMQTLIGDLMLIYRCFIIYQRRWVVVIAPLTLWISTLVTGTFVIYLYAHLRVSTNVDEKHLVPFITATLSLTLVQTVLTTCMITFRILWIDRQVAQFRTSTRRSRFGPLLRIIIESGAIYTISTFIFLMTYVFSNNAQYPVSDCDVQIIGIVFNMIIIRVHQGRTAEQDLTYTRNTSLGTGAASSGRGYPHHSDALMKKQSHPTVTEQYTMEPVRVNVVQDSVQDDGGDSSYVDKAQHWPAPPAPLAGP